MALGHKIPRGLHKMFIIYYYQEACTAIQQIDPGMPCMIGAAKYYNPCNLNETMIIDNENVIYAFNWFIPKAYCKGSEVNYTITYPGKMRCCDLEKTCLAGWCQNNHCNASVDINRAWLSSQWIFRSRVLEINITMGFFMICWI